MILDIDHIAISALDFSVLTKILSKLEYTVEFNERKVRNPKIKEKLMKKFPAKHDLCLLKSKKNVNIELLNHNNINKKNGFVIPIFDCINDDFSNRKDEILKIKNLEIPIIVNENNNEFVFNKMIIETNDVKGSRKFWKSLGFLQKNKEKDHYLFKSVFSEKEYEIFLKQRKTNAENNLDDNGWNCITLFSNSITKEHDFFKSKYFTTDIEILELNQNKVGIFFTKSPGGELIEIISIIK